MKKKWMFLLFGACALYGALDLLGVLLTYIFLSFQTSSVFTTSEASSIGIIGGADGPTAIFVVAATRQSSYILPVLLLIIGICGLLWLRRRK